MKEFDATTYKEQKGAFNDADENLLASLLQDYNEGRILDIGCGDGKLTQRIRRLLPKSDIVGLDNSPEQIRLAKADESPVSFVCSDIINYSDDEKFDLLYSFYAFPHIPKSNLLEAFSSARKLLKDGGKFYLFTNICLFNTQIASREDQEACDITFLNDWPSQINLISLEEIRELFSKSKFVEISDQNLETGAKVKEYGDMISWLFVLE